MTDTNKLASARTTPSPVVGRRRAFYFNDTGQPAYQVYDLLADDFMNPQLGDEFFHGDDHDRMVKRVGGMLRRQHRFSPTLTVHLHPKLIWMDATLDQPMPDIVLVSDLTEPLAHRPVLDLAAERASVRAIVEITSPLLADQDFAAKTALYAKAGVPEYWIVDLGARPETGATALQVFGYVLEQGRYQTVTPGSDGAYPSRAIGVWFKVEEGTVIIGDLRTGKPVPPPDDDDDPTIATQAEAARRAQSIAGRLKL